MSTSQLLQSNDETLKDIHLSDEGRSDVILVPAVILWEFVVKIQLEGSDLVPLLFFYIVYFKGIFNQVRWKEY